MPEWKDRLLEYAYTLFLDGTCDACGGPRFECRHPDNAGLYEVQETTCHRQAAVEEHTGRAGFKQEPGQRFYATEIDPELITRRTFHGGEQADQVSDPGNDQPAKENGGADQ